MTRNDIVRMAREVGFETGTAPCEVVVRHSNGSWVGINAELIEFAHLIAATEREACAAICDTEGHEWDSVGVVTEKNYAAHCAAAIRTRGNQ